MTDRKLSAVIDALLQHVKLLNHYATRPGLRIAFLNDYIIGNFLHILRSFSDGENGCNSDKSILLFVEYCVILLYNLSFNRDITTFLKSNDLPAICSRFLKLPDTKIRCICQILLANLSKEALDDSSNFFSLAKLLVDTIGKSIKPPKLFYQGFKLVYLLKSIKSKPSHHKNRLYFT